MGSLELPPLLLVYLALLARHFHLPPLVVHPDHIQPAVQASTRWYCVLLILMDGHIHQSLSFPDHSPHTIFPPVPHLERTQVIFLGLYLLGIFVLPDVLGGKDRKGWNVKQMFTMWNL